MRKLWELKKVKLDSSKMCRHRGSIAKFAVIAVFIFAFALYGIAVDTSNKEAVDQSVPKAEVSKETQNQSKQVKGDISKTKDEIKNVSSKVAGNPSDKQDFVKKMKELQNQRRKISLEIYQLRVKLIKEKPDLQVLQRSTMDMHRRMAVELNKDEQMKKMIVDAKKVDTQIMELINQNK